MPVEIVKKSKKTGLAPGSLIYIGDELPEETRTSLITYSSDNVSVVEVATQEECLVAKDQAAVTWINIYGLQDAKLIATICQHYGVHSLIIEDILNTEQRPKIDMFAGYIFFIVRLYFYNTSRKVFSTQQVSFILGKNFIITVQEKISGVFSAVRERIRNPDSIMRCKGSDYLAYSLLDVAVDSYFKIVEAVGDRLEDLEEDLITKTDKVSIREIHTLKREMIFLRKSVWPLREVISGLQGRIGGLIQSDTALYLKDIYDHTIQVIDTVETYRDLLAGMLEIYLSTVNNKLNETMKVLTVFASIFIPLTFVTSLYGMNFNPTKSPFNMPELNWYFGYPYALGIMAAMVIFMLWFFKKKKWW